MASGNQIGKVRKGNVEVNPLLQLGKSVGDFMFFIICHTDTIINSIGTKVHQFHFENIGVGCPQIHIEVIHGVGIDLEIRRCGFNGGVIAVGILFHEVPAYFKILQLRL